MKLNITFPVIESHSSEYYGLILKDTAGVTHYWTHDGKYDGMSSDCNIDPQSGTCLN